MKSSSIELEKLIAAKLRFQRHEFQDVLNNLMESEIHAFTIPRIERGIQSKGKAVIYPISCGYRDYEEFKELEDYLEKMGYVCIFSNDSDWSDVSVTVEIDRVWIGDIILYRNLFNAQFPSQALPKV